MRVRTLLEQLVAADTENPPGNEARAAALGAARLQAAGISYQLFEFAPGRQNLIARIKGNGSAKPLLLLAHIDVVPTAGQSWTSPPHRLTEKDGYLVGRGTTDGNYVTDSRQLRAAGILAYGFTGLALTDEDSSRAHGADERIPAGSLRRAMEMTWALVVELAGVN